VGEPLCWILIPTVIPLAAPYQTLTEAIDDSGLESIRVRVRVGVRVRVLL